MDPLEGKTDVLEEVGHLHASCKAIGKPLSLQPLTFHFNQSLSILLLFNQSILKEVCILIYAPNCDCNLVFIPWERPLLFWWYHCPFSLCILCHVRAMLYPFFAAFSQKMSQRWEGLTLLILSHGWRLNWSRFPPSGRSTETIIFLCKSIASRYLQ